MSETKHKIIFYDRSETNPSVHFIRDDHRAVLPTKGTELSIGYDLTVIDTVKKFSEKTTLFDTGLKVTPPKGYYTEIVPRSSLSKTGYILANSVGIIDEDYRGRLMIALTKVDDSMPDLVPPFTRCQLILRKGYYYKVDDVTEYYKEDNTSRGSGGFGSTDKNLKE
jgi:dUTP pyrophosphatase